MRRCPTHTFRRVAALALAQLLLAGVVCRAQGGPDAQVSPDTFGQVVDVVTPGHLHWSMASGDAVDPDGDSNDLDNNFGEHAGALSVVRLSDQAARYGQGTVAEEFAYADADSSVSWRFKVPEPGHYVMVTRFWRELPAPTSVLVSYRSGDRWVDLPPVTDVDHWGGYSRLSCFLLKAEKGQTAIPVRVKALSGRCLVFRVLLGRKRDAGPFPTAVETRHPNLHFNRDDIPSLREKTTSGPPKLALEYMTGQLTWYRNTLSRGDRSWTPKGASHHVPRSIAQTAFVYAVTGSNECRDDVLRMIDTVAGWPRDADAIVDQKNGFNILGRVRILSAIATAYDWLYEAIPATRRQQIARLLDEEANRLFLYNETVVGNTESHNWDPWIGAGYGMAGLALYREHRWPTDWIQSAKRCFRVNLHLGTEDFGYFNNGFTKGMDFAVSLYTTTGEDIITPEAEWLRNLFDFRMMMLTPRRDGYPQLGDANAGNDPLLALCLTKFLGDPLAQWYLDTISTGTSDQIKSWGWNHMMPVAVAAHYDAKLAGTPAGPPRLPLARSFANTPALTPGIRGVTILRTGYDNENDIQLAFRSADYGGWHGHPDQGSFVLNAYGDNLVVDRALGAPYGTPKSTFSKGSLAHSIVLIDGKGQVEYGPPVYHDRTAGATGPLLHTDFVDYVVADSTVAYRKGHPPGQFRRAQRHVVFVRKPGRRAYVIVVDDVEKDDEPHTFDWLLQLSQQHQIDTVAPDHRVVRGRAELHVLTLTPTGCTAQTTDTHDLWRTLKLTAPEATPRGLFANVLYPSKTGSGAPAVNRLNGTGNVAAHLGDEELVLVAQQPGNLTAAGVRTDGKIAIVGKKEGRTSWFLCVEATSFELDGVLCLTADAPITAAVDAAATGMVVSKIPTTATIRWPSRPPQTLKLLPGTTRIR